MFFVRPFTGLGVVVIWIGLAASFGYTAQAQSLSQNWLLQSDLSSDCVLTAIAVDTISDSYYMALEVEDITDAEISQIGSITSNTQFSLNSFGDKDVCIVKLTSTGEIIWALSAGGNGNDRIEDLAVSMDGNLYMVGHYTGTFDFLSISGEDTNTLPDNGGINEANALIVSYDSNGNLRWYSKEGGNNNDKYFALDLTSQGVVAIGTYFENNSEDILGINVTSPNNDEDVFISSYTFDGNPSWLIAGGSTEPDFDHGTELYPSNYNICTYRDTVYFVAAFVGTVFDVDYSTNFSSENASYSVSNPTVGNTVVLGSISKEGQILWMQRQRDTGSEQGPMGIGADCNGVYISGTASGSLIWEGDVPSITATLGGADIFIAKYNKDNGSPLWYKLLSNTTEEGDFSSDLTCDRDGDVIAVGRIGSPTSFQGNTLPGENQGSGFVVSLNSDGDYQAHLTINSVNEEDFLAKIQLDQNKDLYVGGTSGGDLDGNQISSNVTLNGFTGVIQNDHIVSSFCCSGVPYICSGDTLVGFVNMSCEAVIPDIVSMYGTNSCSENTYLQNPTDGTIVGEGWHTIVVTNVLGEVVCERTIQMLDTIDPILSSCPGDQFADFSNNCDYVVPDYISLFSISLTDNCSSPTLVQNPAPGSLITASSPIQIFNNGSEVCSFWLYLIDNTNPTIVGCPGDLVVEFSSGCNYTVPNFISQFGMSVQDNCNTTYTLVQEPAPGEIIYSNTVCNIYIQELPAVFCSFSVDVIDNLPPSIICSPEILTCDQTVYYSLDFIDNCTFDNYEIVPNQYYSGAIFPVGTTTVSINAWDMAGNTSTCSFMVTVNPFDCCTPANLPLISVSNSNPCQGVDVSFSLLQSFDWVQWYGSNDGGSTFDLLPFNNESFFWNADSDLIVKALVSANGCSPVWTSPMSIDVIDLPIFDPNLLLTLMDCEAVMPNIVASYNSNSCWNFVQSIPAGTILNAGIYDLSIEELNTGTVYTGQVLVPDMENPQIVALNIVTLPADQNCGYELSFDELDVSFSDCELSDTTFWVNGATWNITSTYLVQDGDVVDILSEDISGNSTSHQIVVILIDLTCPVFSGPNTEYIDVQFDGNCGFFIEDYTDNYPVLDNCMGVVPASSIIQIPAPGTFIATNTTITLAATDGSGNTCQKFLEIVFEDNVPPVLSCPDTVMTSLNESCFGNLTDVTSLISVDDCSLFSIQQNPSVGTAFYNLEAVPISIQVQDEFGNISTCVVTNHWQPIELPVVVWPMDTTIYLDSGCTLPVPDFTDLDIQNSCGYIVEQNPIPGIELNTGSHVITLNVEFEVGEAIDYSFVLIVTDTISPEVICPADMLLDAEDGLCGSVVQYSIEVDDNCGVLESVLTMGYPSGSVFPIGANIVEYEISDLYGNMSTCLFTIEVQDISPPQTSTIDVTSCSQQVYYDNPLVSDACEYTIIPDPENIPSGGVFPFGNTELNWTITDASGNVAIASQVISIVETPDANWLPIPDQICENSAPIDLADLVTSSWPFEFNDPFNIDNTLNPQILGPGNYEVTLTTSNGPCLQDSSQSFEIIALPELIAPSDLNYCGLYADLEVETTGDEVEWLLPNLVTAQGSVLQDNISLMFPNYGSFDLLVETSFGGLCAVSAVIDVTLWEQPGSIFAGEDQVLYILDHTTLQGQYDGPGTVQWLAQSDAADFSDSNNLLTEVTGLSSGFNSIYISATNGPCNAVTDELLVEVKGLIIPTVFSPNGDGSNETFEIRGLENIPTVKLSIFDDWGLEIYSSDDYTNDWNGDLASGKLCADGTYYYALKIEEEVLMGFIELKR